MRLHFLLKFILFGTLVLSIAGCGNQEEPPVITKVTPESGSAGDLIAFEGMNLGNLTAVKFNDEEVSFNKAFNSDIALLYRLPDHLEEGDYVVSFITAGGTAQTDFLITLPPAEITSINPQSATVGSEVTINGRHFYEPLQVFFFENVPAEIISSDTNRIVVKVPEEARGGPIKVVTATGDVNSPSPFFQYNEVLVADFDGNGMRSNIQTWIFSGSLNQNSSTAIHNTDPEPINGNFLKISGQDALDIGFIGGVMSPFQDVGVFQNFGIRSNINRTFLQMDINTNGRTDTRMLVALRERDGSLNEFSTNLILDKDGWVPIRITLNKFKDLNGLIVNPAKVMSVRLILFDSESTGSVFEANIDNIRFIENF